MKPRSKPRNLVESLTHTGEVTGPIHAHEGSYISVLFGSQPRCRSQNIKYGGRSKGGKNPIKQTRAHNCQETRVSMTYFRIHPLESKICVLNVAVRAYTLIYPQEGRNRK